MALTKFAAFETLSVEVSTAGNRMQRRAMAKDLGCKPGTIRTLKTAHRAAFEYEPRPGFLYVRSRAISSRCNDNYDEFPADEIKQAYATFVGKPVFVNHHNENHRRARGVIIDAALHEDVNPDGTPDTWVEVLMEVDAVKFPKLAKAILAGEIERTSMGTDVAYSKCSFCGNKASTPNEYCAHIPRLKGKRIRRTTASGTREDVLVREICYGLGFFENSLLVEDPADPTAYFLGVDDRGVREAGLTYTAAVEQREVPALGYEETIRLHVRSEDEARVQRLLPLIQYGTDYNRAVLTHLRDYSIFTGRGETESAERYLYLAEVAAGFEEWDQERAAGRPSKLPGIEGSFKFAEETTMARTATKKTSAVDLAFEAMMKEAYGETVAPADVDTLRDEQCPVCSESDTYDGDTCSVCGFVKPPDEFMDPDLEQAKKVDLRQNADDTENSGEGDLKCDNCGKTFNSKTPSDANEAMDEEMEKADFNAKDDDEDDDKKKPFKAFRLAAFPPADDDKKKSKDGEQPEMNGDKDPLEEEEADEIDTAPKAGDACPSCGEGTLQPLKAEQPDEDGPEDPNAPDAPDGKDGADDKKPDFLKGKASLSVSTQILERGDTARATAGAANGEGADVAMRPALAALVEQQKQIKALRGVVGEIVDLAGLGSNPKVAALLKQADETNPAQPIPDPPAEAPAATTPEALAPDAKDDVTTMGATPATDVSADATTSLDSTETVLSEPLDLNEQNVEAPVAGTEEVRPLDEVKTETEIRAGNPNDPTVAFPLQGDFAQRATTGSVSEGRTFASLRLARLRIQAGISTTADDLALATDIAGDAAVSDEAIQTEIETLSKVITAAKAKRPTTASRGLVPRAAAAAERTMPSLATQAAEGEPSLADGQSVDLAVSDEEFLFD